jgi:hypothetical protein
MHIIKSIIFTSQKRSKKWAKTEQNEMKKNEENKYKWMWRGEAQEEVQ